MATLSVPIFNLTNRVMIFPNHSNIFVDLLFAACSILNITLKKQDKTRIRPLVL